MGKSKEEVGREKFDDLMNKMSDEKKKWDEEADSDDEDETAGLLDQAIEMAIEQGRGWAPGEKEAYLEKILDDDFVSSSIITLYSCFCGVFSLISKGFLLNGRK
jgi:hypothetical protein